MIDLRSDTVTQPTPEMRAAMANAAVGDDVLGDDPTVHQLETYVANLLGKEAAVYMPSGTMTNQVALRLHTEPGDEVILESEAHIYYYEAGGPAALSGLMCRLIPGDHGIFSAAQLLEQGVAVFAVGSHSIRAVTNLMVNTAQIDQALEITATAMASLTKTSQPAQPSASVTYG